MELSNENKRIIKYRERQELSGRRRREFYLDDNEIDVVKDLIMIMRREETDLTKAKVNIINICEQ